MPTLQAPKEKENPHMADFRLTNHGTISLLAPLTAAAEAWIDEHLPEDAQMLGNAIAIEPRYVGDIVAGILTEGLSFT